MIKVVIISYFFPPSNFVGGERTAAWAKHLHESGIYPIVITRRWNEHQKDLVDPLIDNELHIEKTETYEIRKLPYQRSLRDKLSSYTFLKPLQKALTLKELIFSNYFIRSLPYSNFYEEAKAIIQQEDIAAVIVSGRPFHSFFIGHQLKKEFDLLWIPDYRDEWSTHRHLESQGKLRHWITKLEQKSEQKWTANADFFLTVSDEWAQRIGAFLNKPGKVVLNGYNQLVLDPERTIDPHNFNITYAGTLYSSQNIRIFLNAVIHLIKKGKPLHVRFIGAGMNPQEVDRIQTLISGFESHFTLMDRMPKQELDSYLNASDLLFLTSFENIKGWYPVKLFEYYASGIPLLLCPSDKDCMEHFVHSTNAGFIANTEEECEKVLEGCVKEKREKGSVSIERNIDVGRFFSRKNQTKLCAENIKNALQVDTNN